MCAGGSGAGGIARRGICCSMLPSNLYWGFEMLAGKQVTKSRLPTQTPSPLSTRMVMACGPTRANEQNITEVKLGPLRLETSL